MANGKLLTVMAHPDDAELWGRRRRRPTRASAGTQAAVPRTNQPVRDRKAAAGLPSLGGAQLRVEVSETAVSRVRQRRLPERLLTDGPVAGIMAADESDAVVAAAGRASIDDRPGAPMQAEAAT